MTTGTAGSFVRASAPHPPVPNQLARIPTHRWDAKRRDQLRLLLEPAH